MDKVIGFLCVPLWTSVSSVLKALVPRAAGSYAAERRLRATGAGQKLHYQQASLDDWVARIDQQIADRGVVVRRFLVGAFLVGGGAIAMSAPGHAASAMDLIERVTDAFFSLDRDWRFTYVNAEAERVLLRSRQELLGESIWEAFPDAVESTFWHEYHRALDSGEMVQFTDYYPPLETWFEVRAYPSSDGLSVYFRNVNEQRRLEEIISQLSRIGGAQPLGFGKGKVLSLPDALIAATALIASTPLYTCNPRHYPMPELDLCPVVV